MNKYITLLPENEVLACQKDCLNPVNRFTQYLCDKPRNIYDSSFLWSLEVGGVCASIRVIFTSAATGTSLSLLRLTSISEEWGEEGDRTEVVPWRS